MTGDYATIVAITHAVIPDRVVYGRVVSGAMLKMVLVSVWSFEGEPVKIEQLAERAGVGYHAARFAVAALIEHRMVRRKRRRHLPSVYLVDKVVLARQAQSVRITA